MKKLGNEITNLFVRRKSPLSSVFLIIASTILPACIQGPGLFKKSGAVGSSIKQDLTTSTEGGISSAAFDPRSSVTQVMTAAAGSAIAGAGISFPPGSLGSATTISIQEGTPIATVGTASLLSLGTKISSAGPAVVVSSSLQIDADKPFTVSIPTTSTGLFLSNDNVVVIYKIYRAASDDYFVGVFTRDQLSVDGGIISFDTKWFGSYQAAVSDAPITKPVEVKSDTPILTKAEEAKLPDIVWSLGTPVVSEAKHEATTSIKVTGFAKLVWCAAYTFDSPDGNLIDTESTDDSDDLSQLSSTGDSYTYHPATNDAQTVYFHFECMDENGRQDSSPWTSAAVIPKAIESSSGTAANESSSSSSNNNSGIWFDDDVSLYHHPSSRVISTQNGTITLTGDCIGTAGSLNIESDTSGVTGSNSNAFVTPCTNNRFSFTVGTNYSCNTTVCLPMSTPRGTRLRIVDPANSYNLSDVTIVYYVPDFNKLNFVTDDLNTIASDKYNILTQDIDMSTVAWTPKATMANGFLEGDDHTITGLNYSTSLVSSYENVGLLFSTIGDNVQLGHFVLSDPLLTINANAGAYTVDGAGIIAGAVTASTGTVNLKSIGLQSATLTFSGSSSHSYGNNVAGFIGKAKVNTTIESVWAESLTVDAPYAQNVGGIANDQIGMIVDSSIEVASIVGKSSVGGISGNAVYYSGSQRIERVRVTMLDSSSQIEASISSVSAPQSANLGGIVGNNEVEIDQAYASVNLISGEHTTSIGGIAGLVGHTSYIQNVMVVNSNIGSANTTMLGGFVGFLNTSASNSVSNAYIEDTIFFGSSVCGGAVGQIQQATNLNSIVVRANTDLSSCSVNSSQIVGLVYTSTSTADSVAYGTGTIGTAYCQGGGSGTLSGIGPNDACTELEDTDLGKDGSYYSSANGFTSNGTLWEFDDAYDFPILSWLLREGWY